MPKQITADGVRTFVRKHYIDSARKVGQTKVTIRTGTVHDQLGLTARFPLICEVLDGKKFSEFSRVTLADRKGPLAGSHVWFTFDVLP